MMLVPQTLQTLQNPQKQTAPETPDEMVVKMNKWVDDGIERNEKFWKRVAHARKVVSGFNWKVEPTDDKFLLHRANLIHAAISVILPKAYARNPEASVTQKSEHGQNQLFCKTLEKVINASVDAAGLKQKAKDCVRASMVASIGCLKLSWQKDIRQDPIILSRINDTQDNINRIDALLAEMTEGEVSYQEQELAKRELELTLQGLEQASEVVVFEGLAIDHVPIDRLIVDEDIQSFNDYPQARRIAQLIPMRKSAAEAMFGIELKGAKSMVDVESSRVKTGTRRLLEGSKKDANEDDKICIVELWDKDLQQVLTFAHGCNYLARDAYAPEAVGDRWYPYFLMPYQTSDGCFVGPSLFDLTEKLQDEHNEARERFNKHRRLYKPGYIADKSLKPTDVSSFVTASDMEVTLVDFDGKDPARAFVPRQNPQVDPAIYSTDAARQDFEMVTGQQDAARGIVVKTKTATEAGIMERSMSARVSEFNDQIEDILGQLYRYTAQLCLMSMTPAQVERLIGGKAAVDFDWPEATSHEDVLALVHVNIRAGSNGAPNKIEEQEKWNQLLPQMTPLIQAIIQARASGMDAKPYEELLKETCRRFDDRIDPAKFIPQEAPQPPALSAQTEQPIGQPPEQTGGLSAGLSAGLPPQIAAALSSQTAQAA